MSHLTQEQLAHLRALMEERDQRLRVETRELFIRNDEHSYREQVGVPDVGDQSVADLMADLDNAQVHRHIQELRDIEAAFGRMDKGSYGECIDCGLAIDYERLAVFPTASRCQICQDQYERTHGQNATPTL